MAYNRKLLTDSDLGEAMERALPIRVFQNDQVVGAGGIIIRFDNISVVIQSSVSDIAYHRRSDCEFFSMRKK